MLAFPIRVQLNWVKWMNSGCCVAWLLNVIRQEKPVDVNDDDDGNGDGVDVGTIFIILYFFY